MKCQAGLIYGVSGKKEKVRIEVYRFRVEISSVEQPALGV